MQYPNCNVTPRKYAKPAAAKVIQRFVRHRNTLKKIRQFTNKVQGRRLARFMTHVDADKRRSAYLNAVCSDAGVCIAFGKEVDKIKSFFSGFVDFNYLKSHVKRIGNVSSNGFVKLLQYERAGYTANAILKCSAKPEGDNLLYEYLVGMYINKQCGRFPCFVETYGLFKFVSEMAYLAIEMRETNMADTIKKGIAKMTPGDFKNACRNSKFCAILVQHIKNTPSLADKCHDITFVQRDLLYVLFQIYMPLSLLKDEFTHYDLHLDNVLVYEPVKDNYIEYHYHMSDDTVVTFKTCYIAKIIDYGRSYFNDTENANVSGASNRIYQKVCSEPACEPDCGSIYGFSWLAPHSKNPLDNYYISSQVPNRSHDLRLLDMMCRASKTPAFKLAVTTVRANNPELYTLAKRVKYEMKYGTPEIKRGRNHAQIWNVEDAKHALLELIMRVPNIQDNAVAYSGKTKLGDMHVYSDGRPLQYISV
jgi:hypothetical protein